MTRFFKGLFYEERLIRVFFWSSFADRSMTLGPIRYCSLTVVMISMFWGVNCWALSGQTAVSVMSFSYKVSWNFLFITYSWLCSAFHLKSFQTAPLVIVSFPVIYFVRTVLNLGNKFRCIFLWDTARKKKKKKVSKCCTNQERPHLKQTFVPHFEAWWWDVRVTFSASSFTWNCTSSCACTSAFTGWSFLPRSSQEKHFPLESLVTSIICYF